MMNKYKVNEFAKDFNMQTKEMVAIINEVTGSAKKSTSALEDNELNAVFNYLTVKSEVSSFDAYFAKGDEVRAEKQKAVEQEKERKLKEQAEIANQLKQASEAAKKPQQPSQEARKPQTADDATKVSQQNVVRDNRKPFENKKFADNRTNDRNARPQQQNQNSRPQQQQQNARPGQNQNSRPAQNSVQKQTPKRPEQTKVVNNKTYTPPVQQKVNKDSKNGVEARKQVQEHRIDTRQTNVELDRYNEKYEKIAPTTSKFDNTQRKQKLHQRSQNYRKPQGAKRETEADKLRRLQLERIKAKPIEIVVGDEITVSDLALKLKKTAAEVIKKLMMLGQMAGMNDLLDYDTAEIVATELGAKISKEVVVTIEERIMDINEDKDEDLLPRDPVVVVMGHVDHGKTSLLDKIRSASVTSTEAGGITQHIGAYRVPVGDRKITFLDTPGHAAFTSMRQRGAQVTDIAILVVAADDGIMPQTIEAISHAKAAGVQIIVAINKMDKPDTNVDKIMQQLTEHELVPEEWGGDVMCVPVSAKTGLNIDKLLENVMLIAEMAELKANPNRKAKGAIIEARLDKGRGPVATVLVQNGTLKSGDIIVAGSTVGRVRVMMNDKGEVINEAGPSVPVEITGLAETPSAGDSLDAVSDERLARELVEQRKNQDKQDRFNQYQVVTLDNLFDQISEGDMKELNIIVKADVQGSVEAVKQSLTKLSNSEVRVRVIHGGVGAVSESDVMLAATSGAIIVGFNVRPDPVAQQNAEKQGVDLRLYRIIYDAIEEIESAIKGMLAPKFREVPLGRIEVREVFKISNVGAIAGCYVLDGKVTRHAEIRVVRDGIVLCEDKMSSLKRFKDDVKEVASGYECGIALEKYNDVKEGDIYEAFLIEEYRD